MSVRSPELRGPPGLAHPVVLERRARDLLAQTLAVVVPAALALTITVAFPAANIVEVLAAIAGVVALVVLTLSTRLALTTTVVTIYLLLLDGPVKLGIGARQLTAAVPDLLLGAVCLGALLRTLARGERVRMPPLSAWVLAFVGIVLVEAFNPNTPGMLKALAGLRQQLQWVPFFFLGYALLRSKQRLRMLFVVVGICAVANGVVSTYQTKLSPSQVASWGPGYQQLYQPATLGKSSKLGRVYGGSGENAHIRPVGLGSDSGFSGGVGMLGMPFGLALLATWRGRRRWVAAVIVLGSAMGALSGLGRLQVIGGMLCVAVFIAYASLGGQAKRPLAALATVALLAIPVGAGYLAFIRHGTFKRYESLENSSAEQLATHKAGAYSLIPHDLEVAPFGVGLGTVGAVGGFEGKDTDLIEGHTASAETQYNFIVDELGAPGLVLWAALSLYIVALTAQGLRAKREPELTIMLAAAMAPFAALIMTGFSGPFETSAALGPYFWLAIGVAAYWFAGPGRASASEWRDRVLQRPMLAGAS